MSLDRLMECAAVIESVPGTLQGSAYAAANAKFLVIDPQISYDPAQFQRNFKRSTLTGIEALMGLKPATVTFSVEVAGQAVTTPDVPTWDVLLKGCGFKSVVTEKGDLTSVSAAAPFRHGETVTGGTSAKTAVVVHDGYPNLSGELGMYVHSASGAFTNGETITGSQSGATATLTLDWVDAGQSWYPVSAETITIDYTGTDPSVGNILTGGTSAAGGSVISVDTVADSCVVRLYTAEMFSAAETVTNVTAGGTITADTITIGDIPTLSIAVNIDGTVQYLRGARGNVEFSGNVGEPMLMRFTFQGIAVDPVDKSLLSGVTYESKVPPVMLGISLSVKHESDTTTANKYTPRASAITYNQNNQVAPRTSVNDAGGICLFSITGRDASGTMDPEKTLEANWPWIQDFLDGDIWNAEWTLGSTAGNQFYFSMPGIQTTGAPHAERNGQAVRNLAFRATGGHQTNNSDNLGADNEIAITYLV